MDPVSLALATGVALVAAVWDLSARRIPNGLTYPAILAGCALGLWPADEIGLGLRLAGAAWAFFPAAALFFAGGIGGGDVKLLAAVGAAVGAPAIGAVLVHAFAAGGIAALASVVGHKRGLETLRECGAVLASVQIGGPRAAHAVQPAPGLTIAFAPALLAGLVWTALAAAFGLGGLV